MKSSYYLVIESKIHHLAEVIARKRLNPYSILLNAAVENNVVSSVYNTINENWETDQSDQYHQRLQSVIAQQRKEREEQEKARQTPKSPPQLPRDLNSLTSMLNSIIGDLMWKHGMNDEKINSLVTSAIKDANGRGTGTFTVGPGHSGGSTHTLDAGAGQIDPELAKQLGIGTWHGDGNFNPKEPVAAKKGRTPTDPNKPTWHDQMTSAEKAWYDQLSPALKKRFIGMHDAKTGGQSMGDAFIKPGTSDHDAIDKIAYFMNQRRKAAGQGEDPDAWKKAAGLWNRQQIRKKMTFARKGRNQEVLPNDSEDLLGKDHYKPLGKMLSEWCHLAGIAEEKKSKRKGR